MSITFLIPVFNEVKTVKKAIEETIDLKISNKEIIIVDNNSTDGSKDIIKEYQNREKIHIIYQKKNHGFGNSIQDGFLKSSNESTPNEIFLPFFFRSKFLFSILLRFVSSSGNLFSTEIELILSSFCDCSE